ncbi:hypothetical protein [Francisella noatunensis]|uniref:hypothetical protein n=1 Tax=Francisella noatunensis TaxID=657445 RepID=UPI001F425202|nr:hypothetical protein [Francisella noatunensis]
MFDISNKFRDWTYHNQNIIFYLGVFLISLSIFFESQLNRQIIEAIVLPNESDNEC